MPCIDSLTEESWRLFVSDSNQAAMRKKHKYPLYERPFLDGCCTFQQAECTPKCFCHKVGCGGVWTLRSDVKFQVFLSHYCNLWVTGKQAFTNYVENDSRTGWPPRWKNGIRLLREIKKQWPNWDGYGHSLPSVVSSVTRCYFCDDSFTLMKPVVQTIQGMVVDKRGVYTSKLVSQLFYDIAVPFDTDSRKKQKACGYEPQGYGDGRMREQAKDWLLANNKSVDDFRKLDGAPESCWSSPGRGTTCSRVLDKLFYK
jgi:hypothetical protein